MKRRRMDSGRNEDVAMFDLISGAEHPALSRGLRAGREGFSLDDLQMERAKKIGSDTVPESQSEQS
jgi:hypothetical protein